MELHINNIEANFAENLKNQGWEFLQNYFEGVGWVTAFEESVIPACGIYATEAQNLSLTIDFCKIPCVFGKHQEDLFFLEWKGNNALDFLGKIYESYTGISDKAILYQKWCGFVPQTHLSDSPKLVFQWKKTLPDAVSPFKERVSDSGYDLTLIQKIKDVGKVTFYETGICIQPPFGWYFDLVPRSSISKTGYMLANSVGIIDRSYTGNIMIPLIKVDDSFPDLALPSRIVQIIPRPIVHFGIQETDTFEETARGESGFGSTGK
jgi:dUTP pyrophosphatase